MVAQTTVTMGHEKPYRNEALSMASTERAYVRNVISKFGGMIQVGTAVAIPPQTWERNVPPGRLNGMPYMPAERKIITAGIPGYCGHLPNGSVPNEAYAGLRGANSNHSRRHDRFAYDRSLQPKRMPIVGYSGHLRNTKASLECYGTSKWRPVEPTTKAAQMAASLENAKKRAMEDVQAKHNMDMRAFYAADPQLQC